MTGEELCGVLQVPAETPATELLSAWERRRAEIAAALDRNDQAKPVKLRLREELRRLDEGAEVAQQLRIAAEAEHYLREAEAEAAKGGPPVAVVRLYLDKARPLVAEIPRGLGRFALEKRMARIEASTAGAVNPPTAPEPPPVVPPLPGRVLELSPCPVNGTLRGGTPTVRFIARQQFTIGRAAAADFVARHWPESEENRQRTNTISRINATFLVRGRQICIQDGRSLDDGTTRRSRNGTWVDERRIGAPVALNFAKERRIKLGQFSFQVSALHIAAAAIDGDLPLPAAEPPLGCLRVRSVGEAAAQVSVWLLSDATLGSGPGSAVALDPGLPAIAARVHHRAGGFWLQVPTGAKSVLSLDGRRRAAGDVLALKAEHELRLGDYVYTVRIE